MKRMPFVIAAALTALVLAACNVVVEVPGPPDTAIPVTANSNPAAPVDFDRTYSQGEEKVFRVTAPSLSGGELLYVELNRNLRLEVRPGGTSYQNVAFSSSSYTHFGSGVTGVASAAEGEFGAQAINTPITCRGSCILLDNPASEFYVRVVNNGASSVNNVDLFIYVDSAADPYEPGNDTVAGAEVLAAFDSGAIETVGDTDFWAITTPGTLNFDAVVDGIDIEAYIVDASGTPIAQFGGPYAAGETIQVLAGDYLKVWAVSASQAAASANSTYYLDYGGPVSERR